MPRCKCRICGADLDTETAYKVIIKNKNRYYCSQEEYETYVKEREHAEWLVAQIKEALKHILNVPAIVNTYVYKEWAEWNKIASNEVILNYLLENKDLLHGRVAPMTGNEFARIKYLSTILRNSLQSYQEQQAISKPHKQIKEVSVEEYVAKYLDPILDFKADVTFEERAEIIINPMFLEDGLIAEAIRKLSYDEFLATPYWETITTYKRQKANFKCERCGSSKHTQTHHKTYAHHGYEHNIDVINEDLIVLCEDCHRQEHHIDPDDEI